MIEILTPAQVDRARRTGTVARHTVWREAVGDVAFMAITADFAKGSSGCPVLDECVTAAGGGKGRHLHHRLRISASPNSLHFTSFAPSIKRAKS